MRYHVHYWTSSCTLRTIKPQREIEVRKWVLNESRVVDGSFVTEQDYTCKRVHGTVVVRERSDCYDYHLDNKSGQWSVKDVSAVCRPISPIEIVSSVRHSLNMQPSLSKWIIISCSTLSGTTRWIELRLYSFAFTSFELFFSFKTLVVALSSLLVTKEILSFEKKVDSLHWCLVVRVKLNRTESKANSW